VVLNRDPSHGPSYDFSDLIPKLRNRIFSPNIFI
jgi:hypothetical protein